METTPSETATDHDPEGEWITSIFKWVFMAWFLYFAWASPPADLDIGGVVAWLFGVALVGGFAALVVMIPIVVVLGVVLGVVKEMRP